MKRMAMAMLAVIVLATTLYWLPVVQAGQIRCDLPVAESSQVCP